MLLFVTLLPYGSNENNAPGGGGGGIGAALADGDKPPNPENKEAVLLIVVGIENRCGRGTWADE
jgi:hypothetical protein